MLHEVDVSVVENVASLPLNPHAREALYRALHGRRALFRHHDLAWQREATRHLEGPRDEDAWAHVVINARSRTELAARGISAQLLYNRFDCDPPRGERDACRRALGISPRETVTLFPSRAIPRKNVGAALELCESLGATFWLLGPAEDVYEASLEAVLGRASVRVLRASPPAWSIHDAYAACDLVVVSSSWEGFGNPVIESVTHGRPLALSHYPVAEEFRGLGLDVFDLSDVRGLRAELAAPDLARRARNLALVREHFNLAALPGELARLLAELGVDTPVG